MTASRCGEALKLCREAFQIACSAVRPLECVRKSLVRDANRLHYNDRVYSLKNNAYIVAFGKAAASMVEGAEEVLGDDLVAGIASVPIGTVVNPSLKSRFLEGARHNLPDETALQSTRRIVEFLEGVKQDEKNIVVVLISGGGSALLPLPIDGVSLEEKLATIKALTSRGFDIKQLNVVRQKLSKVKGGKLAQIAAPCQVLGVIMSDIVGDPVSLIASGPTVLQESTSFPEIDFSVLPESVSRALQNPEVVPTVSSSNANNSIVCNNRIALDAAAEFFRSRGYTVEIATATLEGDASERADLMRDTVVGMAEKRKHVVLFGGETTVRFPEGAQCGKGGRNQELALATLRNLALEKKLPSRFAFMSAGTDGHDGPTDAAGALFGAEDVQEAGRSLQEMSKHLDAKNSYAFWSEFQCGKCHLKPGLTGTNVMDLQIVLVD
ncbi:hypothetical protein QR680_012406 [Steinernema hermaphroditum]|uniref:Glycerate kinase n=1 Tax=Steinernema hermaphroditum TaxID=289476 RepID=A0AA39I3J0_9BILA|nr:hypothetical protein QR680_012406 [Steinernema hermaphroditum]